MVIFGAATGLRPSELFGLEQHDVDRELGVVYVRRAFANGRIKHTKTRLSTRAVPLQAKAVEALDRLPASVNPILFPNARGGRIDFRVFGRRHWRPAQIAAGVEPIRGLYDMRHRYATFALRAGVPVFAVSRFIGTSIAMIDRHLRPPRPRQPRARRRATCGPRRRAGGGHWVDVEPKPRKRAQQQRFEALSETDSRARGRSVDAEACRRRPSRH
jgi:integrase